MIIESNKLVKGTFKDEYYLLGPNIENKVFNLNQTVKLVITEFLSPNLFFGYEFNEEYYLDEQINLIYNSMNDFFYFDNLPKIGTVCVAKYNSDKRWYRAKVIGQNYKENSVDLYFIDYGNIEKCVHLKYVRKLESTFSTQFQHLMNTDRLRSQAALFGFVGVKPPGSIFTIDEKSKLKNLTINQTFDFQVIDVPIINSDKKPDSIKIPFYLIKSDPFSRFGLKLSKWVTKELYWEECNIDDSLEAIIQSLYKINYDIYTVNFMIPRKLQKFHQSIKPRNSQKNNIANLESDEVEIHNENNGDELDYDSNDLSDLSVKDLSDDEKITNDINDVLIERLSNCSKTKNEEVVLKKINEDDDDDGSPCTIINWKISSSLVESVIEGLSWHLPFPEESVFRAIVTNIDNKIGFHINVCSEDIVKSFKKLEKSLEAHYLLCNNSMLKQFVGVVDLVPGTLCLCAHNSTYNRGLIIGQQQLDRKFKCKLFDYGYDVSLEECDIMPISYQFCQLPPLAIECNLSGFNDCCENMPALKMKFEQLLVKNDFQVLISICYKDKRNIFNWSDDKIILKQPLSVELFVFDETYSSQNYFSMNKILHDLYQENASKIETEPMSVSKNELFLSCSKALDDIEEDSSELDENIIDGMNDIYITQKLLDESELPHPFDKRPVCEYYRTKGRCFKGSKCQDRHVANSDCSDDEVGTEFDWMKLVSYVNRSFERHLRVGSIIGMRVSAIYGYGVFYAFLTHGIVGFENDVQAISSSENEDSEDDEIEVNGLDFPSIHDMENSLGEYMKYKYTPFNKSTNLLPNTLVAVLVDDKIHRGSITSEISINRYQVFLVDYGISLEANLESLFLLPKEYCSVFKKQCFLCKLHGVQIKNETDSKLFADWFWKKVNKRVLHAKVIDTMEDGMNFVELYDFINDNSFRSLNSLVQKDLNL